MKKEPNQKNRITLLLLLLLLLLLGCGLFYFFNKSKTLSVANNQYQSKVTELQNQYSTLEESIKQKTIILNDKESTVLNLTGEIEELKENISQNKKTIIKLDGTKQQLNKTQTKLAEKNKALEACQNTKSQITNKITVLTDENTNLQDTINTKVSKIKVLETTKTKIEKEKEVLMASKEKLEKELKDCTQSIPAGTILIAKRVEVVGLKTKGNGYTAKKRYAANIDSLLLSFEVVSNPYVKAGDEDFHVRVLNEEGKLLPLEPTHSKTFINSLNNQPLEYTQDVTVKYQNNQDKVQVGWKPKFAFAAGNYTIEIYNKGYLSGSKEFLLR